MGDRGFQLRMTPLETPPSANQLRYKVLDIFFFFFKGGEFYVLVYTKF